MAIKITVDGKTYDGIDAITVGGKVLTLAYVEDSTGGDTGSDSGGTTTKTYTIKNNLTNCSNSNSATTITEKTAYTAVITAKSGYELESVTVTMGGSAVGASNGVINIASVTGDIVITASAVESGTGGDSGGTGDDETENNGWVDGQAYAIEWQDGYCFSTSTHEPEEYALDSITGYLPCHGVSAVELSSGVSDNYLHAYDEQKNHIGRIHISKTEPVPINKEIYFIRTATRQTSKGSVTVTPRVFEVLTENTSWIADKYYELPLKNEGISINKDTGKEETHSSYVTSDYAFCYGATTLYIAAYLANTVWRKTVVFYDSEKNYISGDIGKESPYAVPENAMYFRVSGINGFEYGFQKPNKPWAKLS